LCILSLTLVFEGKNPQTKMVQLANSLLTQ
jgi:hypothetical protein